VWRGFGVWLLGVFLGAEDLKRNGGPAKTLPGALWLLLVRVALTSSVPGQFFDKFPVVEPGTKKPLEVVQKMKIQCVASGRGKMLLGDKEGYVNILDRDFALDGFRGD
jgi:hypothetical protein